MLHCSTGENENWLKEADLDFFARGPSESGEAGDSASGAVVQVSATCFYSGAYMYCVCTIM